MQKCALFLKSSKTRKPVSLCFSIKKILCVQETARQKQKRRGECQRSTFYVHTLEKQGQMLPRRRGTLNLTSQLRREKGIFNMQFNDIQEKSICRVTLCDTNGGFKSTSNAVLRFSHLVPWQCPSWATWIFKPVKQASLWSSQ